MFGRNRKENNRPIELPDDLNPKAYGNIMDALLALARAIAELREEVRKR